MIFSNPAGNFSHQQINTSIVSKRNNAISSVQYTITTLSNMVIVSTNAGYKTLTDSRSGIAAVFNDFYEKWYEETKYLSSPGMFKNIYYKKIISLGMDVVPVIINKLKETPCHLFFALHEITGVNPVKSENRGNIKKMSDDWIAWWERNAKA